MSFEMMAMQARNTHRRSEVAQHALNHRHRMVLDVLAEARLDVRHIRALFAAIKLRVAMLFLLVMNQLRLVDGREVADDALEHFRAVRRQIHR